MYYFSVQHKDSALQGKVKSFVKCLGMNLLANYALSQDWSNADKILKTIIKNFKRRSNFEFEDVRLYKS